MRNQVKKTYCPYPFIGASLQAVNVVLPCGQYMNAEPLSKFSSIEEARNSPHMQEMRLKMLKGQYDSGCQCPIEEAAGLESMRQEALRQFGVRKFGKLKTVEIFFDNVCNLKCRMCSGMQSHLWIDDEIALYGTTYSAKKYIQNNTYQQLDVSELEEIKVYGGEPLINQEADNFFGRLLKEGQVENLLIEMSTNCTSRPMSNVLEVFKRCRRLKLNLSIDGFGRLNEFIRSGSEWNSVVENMRYFHDLLSQVSSDSYILVHSAVSVYNINMLDELKNFVEENFPNFKFRFQTVQFPIFLNIKNLPLDYKDKLSETISDEGLRSYMYDGGENYFSHFINFHKGLNQIRNEDLSDINPLLQNYINDYKSNVDSREFLIKCIEDIRGPVPL